MSPHRPVTQARLNLVHDQLTVADWEVLDTLRKLRVATGLQLQHLLHGDGEAAKQRRLRQLTRLSRLQVVTRLERRVIGGLSGGSSSTVYALDVAGLRLLDPSGVARRPWQPSTPFVAHAVAVSQLYVDLTEAGRSQAVELLHFDAEPKCWRNYAAPSGERLALKPDADVTVASGDYEYHWFVEVDRGTESRPRITRKAREYVAYLNSGYEQAERGVTPQILFVVPTERRKAAIVDALHLLDADHWQLFAVCLTDQAIDTLTGRAQETDR